MTYKITKKDLHGLLAVNPSISQDQVDALYNFTAEAQTAAVTATAVTAETIFGSMPCAYKVKDIRFASLTGIAASATDYGTIKVYRKTATATSVLIGSFASTTALGTGVATALTLVDTAAVGLVGDVLTYEVTKTGAGVTVPVGHLTALLERID